MIVRVAPANMNVIGVPLRELRVWAYGANAPLKVGEDARLREGSGVKDETFGQFGWDWGLPFNDFADLTTKLQGATPTTTCGRWIADCAPLRDGELLELAINCHGASGLVDVDCHGTSAQMIVTPGSTYKVLDVTTLPTYAPQFRVLDRLLHPEHGGLFFMCCLTGQLAAGSQFLIEVSKLLPKRTIMALATVGFSDGAKQIRHGKSVAEPGMRDTEFIWAAPTPALEDARYSAIWNDLTALPWATRNSPHVKVAMDGKIVGGAGANM
jgi:hypothetical protein